MRFFDAHNHLQDERFGGRQEALIAACREAGVMAMVVNGSCEADWEAVATLARRHPGFVLPAFGLHPWYVHERSPRWRESLERWLDAIPGATVGEIGIDRWILDCPPAVRAGVVPELATLQAASLSEQEDVFREQFEMAARRDVASSIHCLQAWGRMHELLRAGPVPTRGFLLHSYGGPTEMVRPLAALGARFSFPGYFLHARKQRQREAFRAVPRDRLLVETDAPDQRLPDAGPGEGPLPEDEVPLALSGPDGRPLNHPANLPRVYRGLAKALGLDATSLVESVERAFRGLFS